MAHAGTPQDPIPQYFEYCKTVNGEKKYFVVGKNSIGGGGSATGSPFQIVNSTEQVSDAANLIFVLKK